VVKLKISINAPPFWDEFARHHSGMLFQRSIWARILKQGYTSEPIFCWLEDDDGKAVIGFLGGILDFHILRILNATFPYGGLMGDDRYLDGLIDQLHPVLRDQGIHIVRFIATRPIPGLQHLGYTATNVSRHRINLENYTIDSFLDSLHRSVRKAIRKSHREGVSIEPVTSRESVHEVYDLYLKTMAHNRAAAKYPLGRFMSIYEHLIPADLGIMLIARKDDMIIGSNTLVISEDTVHDIQLSYNPEYQRFRPNDALVFASITWSMQRQMKYFDFMGSPANDASLERFKAKWLAQKSMTTTYSKTLSPARGMCWDLAQKMITLPVGAWFTRWLRERSGQPYQRDIR